MKQALSLCLLVAVAATPALLAVDYSAYHDTREVEQFVREVSSNPAVSVVTIGSSAGGRPIRILRIARGDGADTRPAIFVGANAAGSHNSGTEAALDLVRTLLAGDGHPILATRTFYVAPVLNPDAHDALFETPRRLRSGNGMAVDRDVDGLTGEDGPDDLDGDGRITSMRIADPHGSWLPHPEDARVMTRSDAIKARVGAWRLEVEGDDDDRDGRYNEDPKEGIHVDLNFPKAFPYPRPEAGPWPTRAPETLALVRFILDRPNIAAAFIYGPANNLLDIPKQIEAGGDPGTMRFKVPGEIAKAMGFDPEKEYTLDEIWAVAKDLPEVRDNNLTREDVASFLGAGAAGKLEEKDSKLLDSMAKDYKERLKKAGLDDERPALQYSKGGLTPWLYYHQGLLALELDVWGIPKRKSEAKEKKDDAITLERLETMTSEEFLAVGEEKISTFLQEIKAPAQYTAAMVMQRVRNGDVTPKQMAGMIRQMGLGAAAASSEEDDAETKRARDVAEWAAANAPEAIAPWKAVKLRDGSRAEVGGVDRAIATTPPKQILTPAVTMHTNFILDTAQKLAEVEIASLESTPLGGGVYRVRAVARNKGSLPTHTQMAVRTKSLLPVMLRIRTGDGVSLVTGRNMVPAERLEGSTGTVEGEWLVRAANGSTITVEVTSPSSGSDLESIPAGKES